MEYFVSGCISAQNNVLWPQAPLLCGCPGLCKGLQLLLCIKTLKYGTEFIKDMWSGRSPKTKMKFVNVCNPTGSLSKTTSNKL
jgi:hypothetical protein